MRHRLVPWPRNVVLGVIAASAGVVLILAALVYRDRHANWLDNDLYRLVDATVPHDVQALALHLTDIPLVAGLFVALAIVAALVRRWDVTALAICAPAVAVLVTEAILKPLVQRTRSVSVASDLNEHWAYPSGHETGLATLTIVLGLVLLGSGVRTGRKIAGCVVLGVAMVAGAIALVGIPYHYATDTVGAIGVSLSVTLSLALAIDSVVAARSFESAVSR